MGRARSMVVPTGLFVRVEEVVDFAPVSGDPLRLDQVQLLYPLVERLRQTVMPLDEAREELRRVRATWPNGPPRSRAAWRPVRRSARSPPGCCCR